MELPITQLPDGSGCFTATVMSREEAMALPPEKRPLNYRISSNMYHAVFEAIGAASMCWEPKPGSQVFASEQASKIAVDLCFKIAEELEKKGRRETMDQIAHRETVPELWSDKRSPRPEGEIYICHDYLKIYDREWSKWRDEPIRLMEIGLNVGASVKLWLQYFTQADIVGLDISPFQSKVGLLDPNRFNFIQGDQSSLNFLNEVKSRYPNGFDIIIDDGAHASGPIIMSFSALWGAVKPGGYYVIEDLTEVKNKASHTPGYPNQIEWVRELLATAIMGDTDVEEAFVSKDLIMLRKRK